LTTDAPKKRYALRIVTIGASAAKQNVFDSLRKTPEDGTKAGVIHFPLDYDQEYFEGLCSEDRFVRKDGTVEFRKRRDRNDSPV
jgi:phage terminase large subunit GpA-like protein